MLDPLRQNRFNNSFTVTYPDFPGLNNVVRSVVMHQEMGKHDVVEIYYSRFSSVFFKGIKTGVPVQISWRNDKVKGSFVGYTVDVSYTTAQQLNRDVKVTCVGAAYPLKERSSKIWTNKTATEIVNEVSKKFKLKPFVTPSSIRFTQQSLVGHSYWEKLNELAKRIGYGFQVIGTELHFHPIDKMIDQFMTTIPIMSFKDPLQNPESDRDVPTLTYFEPTIGDHMESADFSRSTNSVGGIDPVTGKSFISKSSSNKVGKNLRRTTKDPLFSTVETQTVVASNAMAKSLSESRAQLGRLLISAKAVGQGDPRISPWRTVEVQGTGETTDGYWIVQKTEHVMHGDGRYLVEFTCLSDGIGSNKPSSTRTSSAGSVPVRNVINEMTTTNQRKPTSTTLSATTTMVKQNNAGYNLTPRRWKAQ
jgi:hypothetical protein